MTNQAHLLASDTPSVSRLGVIGDVHAEDERLALALSFLATAGIQDIACTGDIVDGRGCPNRSVELLTEAGALTIRGNHDRWLIEDKARHVPNAHVSADLNSTTLDYLAQLPTQRVIETVAGPMLLCHGIADNDLKKVWPGTARMAVERSGDLDRLITENFLKFIVNGHMHFRTLMHFTSLTLINAGTLAGEHWPGFSIVDFEAMRIDAFEVGAGDVKPAASLPLAPQPEHTVWENTQCFTGGWNPVRLYRPV